MIEKWRSREVFFSLVFFVFFSILENATYCHSRLLQSKFLCDRESLTREKFLLSWLRSLISELLFARASQRSSAFWDDRGVGRFSEKVISYFLELLQPPLLVGKLAET